MQSKEAKRIIIQIISKGGLISSCAALIKDDDKAVIQFLQECSELTDSEHMIKHWGWSLTKQIKKFAHNNKQRENNAGILIAKK